jgi:hypothetical protein
MNYAIKKKTKSYENPLRVLEQNLKHYKTLLSLFGWLVADSWCWFVLREEYCWLVAGGWFVLRGKYCWLVADKPSEQGQFFNFGTKLETLFHSDN